MGGWTVVSQLVFLDSIFLLVVEFLLPAAFLPIIFVLLANAPPKRANLASRTATAFPAWLGAAGPPRRLPLPECSCPPTRVWAVRLIVMGKLLRVLVFMLVLSEEKKGQKV